MDGFGNALLILQKVDIIGPKYERVRELEGLTLQALFNEI